MKKIMILKIDPDDLPEDIKNPYYHDDDPMIANVAYAQGQQSILSKAKEVRSRTVKQGVRKCPKVLGRTGVSE